jgi:hypothetical protein
MKNMLRVPPKFAAGAVLVAIVNPVSAQWKNESCNLPGVSCGAGSKIAIAAGIGGGAVAGLFLYRHFHKREPAPVEITPMRMEFGADKEQTLSIRPTAEGINLSQIKLRGKGYSIKETGSDLPVLLKPDQPLELKVMSDGPAGKGFIDVTFLDKAGKRRSATVALVAGK